MSDGYDHIEEIDLLEERLGQPLFRRDAEGAHVTDAGARLLPALSQMAHWATESRRIADGFESNPAGPVRVAAPPGTAFEHMRPRARIFIHPQTGERRVAQWANDPAECIRAPPPIIFRPRQQ